MTTTLSGKVISLIDIEYYNTIMSHVFYFTQSDVWAHELCVYVLGTCLSLIGKKITCTFIITGYNATEREIYQMTEAMNEIERGFFSLPVQFPGSPLSAVR